MEVSLYRSNTKSAVEETFESGMVSFCRNVGPRLPRSWAVNQRLAAFRSHRRLGFISHQRDLYQRNPEPRDQRKTD